MQKSKLVVLATLLINCSIGSAANDSPSSQSPKPRSVHSFVGEIIHWRDNKDGTSNILMECMPQRQQIWSETIDNKLLRKLNLQKVLERLDKECQKAMASYG